MIEIIKYIVLGIVQGVTEIFPVSSSGHLIIISDLLNINLDNLSVFLMITNLGSFIALFYFFRKDIWDLIVKFCSFIFKKEQRTNPEVKEGFDYSLKLVISVIPVGIAGLLLEKYIPSNLLVVGLALLLTATLLLIMYMLRNRKVTNEITWTNAAVIGLFQTAAILPGISRSGITTVGGLSQKIDIKDVLKFSFLSYIVISVPVSIKGIIDAVNNAESINVTGYLLAFLFSFIATFITVKILFKFVKPKNLIWFSIYCFLIGAFAITWHFI
ncbi:MAG TPA: undecaprenyl-diphosphate phosphatase [Haploplasma sp.]|nr:undecaprenyl-diphosphate phosphatase [Haploplasma sp.]